MATDRLMNHTQGESIVSALQTIAQKSETPYNASNKLPTDYADDTNQTNKFATAAQLEQIELNKNNILYNANNGVKNTFDFANAPQESNIYTTVVKTSTSLTVTANNPSAGSSSVVYSGKDYPAGDYIFSCKITDYSCTTETAKIYIATSTAAGTGVANKTITGNGTIQIPFHWNGGKVYIKYFPNESNTVNQSNTFTASENMIMLASISDTTYQPYALSNAAITPVLQECVDNGKKNYSSITGLSKDTTTAGFASETNFGAIIPAGTYVVSYDLTRSDNAKTGVIGFRDVDGAYTDIGYYWTTASHQVQTVTFSKAVKAINMYVAAGTTCTLSNLMICKEEVYKASSTYQPYALSNVELTNHAFSKIVFDEMIGYPAQERTYQMTKADFGNISGCGIYMIYCISWEQTPNIAIYTAGYSGGVASYSVLQKVVGNDRNISISGNTITFTTTGRVQIVALQ